MVVLRRHYWSKRKQMNTRRKFIRSIVGVGTLACIKRPGFCDKVAITDDGSFKTTSECIPTATNIEGPYYLTDAPLRNNLRIFGDEGVSVNISGKVVEGQCAIGLSGATIEFWQADPEGKYDNNSTDMKYRCAVITDENGKYSLETLLPGRYLNGTQYRPHHIHVKVWDGDGVERLITQLYFDGDEYLDCDGFANTSLIMPYEGSLETTITAADIDFILS